MQRLNQPYQDLKNIWPLDYTYFFDYKINEKLEAGSLGIFMLVWGIALSFVAVPVLTYFYGKRWYCSWVCGCGGLAETLGDPYRHLSDKSLKAWKIERVMVHSVLVFAVVMTGLVLYTYFSGESTVLGFLDSYSVRSTYGFYIGSIFAGVVGTGFYPVHG
jgi:polyferredoxin